MKTELLVSQYLDTHYPEPEPPGPGLLQTVFEFAKTASKNVAGLTKQFWLKESNKSKLGEFKE